MAEKSLRVIDTNKTFFSKITTTITKILIPTRLSLNNMMITIKRNNLIKAYTNYNNGLENDKVDNLVKKYEDAYALYLEAIDKYIMDSLYKKVKNNTASSFEREALSRYYLVVSLKEKKYIQYKYKKQEYLLKIDYGTINTLKNENAIEKYKTFYATKIQSLYKGLLKDYSVQITDTSKINKEELELSYKNIFDLLEGYVSEILPIKLEQNENKDYRNLEEEYERYEQCLIGKTDEREELRKKVILIGISRLVFTHSLPLVAAEQCYNKIIQEAREIVIKADTNNKKENGLKLLAEIIEEYNIKILSTKVYWDKSEEREEYKKFWNQYKNLENKDKKQREKQKINLLLKYDLKQLNKAQTGNKKIIKILKEKLVEEGEIRQVKDAFISTGKYLKKNENKN